MPLSSTRRWVDGLILTIPPEPQDSKYVLTEDDQNQLSKQSCFGQERCNYSPKERHQYQLGRGLNKEEEKPYDEISDDDDNCITVLRVW